MSIREPLITSSRSSVLNWGITASPRSLLGEQADVELDQAALGAFHQAGVQRLFYLFGRLDSAQH